MNGSGEETEDDRNIDLGQDIHAIEPSKEDGANDIFKHTFVDILDDEKTPKAAPVEEI